MASMILGSIGSSLLGPLGGFLGSALGGMVDQMIFGGGDDANRIDDLKVTRADPGAAVPLVYGADRIPGIVVCTTDLIETKNKEKLSIESLIGKGGEVTYTYHVDIDYLLCEGPILGVARIWADGNIMRGTRYELEASTSEHPENIGGIPYPGYYKDHLYSPNDIPWTIDRASAPNPLVDDGKYYRANSAKSQMVQIKVQEANDLLADTRTVVYWKDTSTGYYIPLERSHGYTGEKPLELGDGGSLLEEQGTRIQVERLKYGTTTYGYGVYEEHIVDLKEYYKERYYADEGFGSLDIELVWTIYSNWNAWGYTDLWSIDFYTGTDGEYVVDGDQYGHYLGSGIGKVRKELTGTGSGWRTYTVNIEGISIPKNTRYIIITFTLLPVLSLVTGVSGAVTKVYVAYTYTTDKTLLRDWPDYWNLYDAINDWSPRAVLAYDGPDDVIVYHGGEYQPQDPTMTAAMQNHLDDTTIEVPAYIKRAHVVFDTLQLADYSNRIPQFSFEVVQYDDVRVPDVVRDIMSRAEVTENYYDVDAITGAGGYHVLGYSVTSKMNFRAALEALLEAFSVDVAEIGNQLVFRDKYREVDWIIPRTELSTVEAGDKLGDPIKLSFRNLVDMPRRLTVRFKDVERDYQPNVAHWQRQHGIQVQDGGVELPVVLPPHVAKAYARDKMRDIWTERVSGRVEAPHKYIYAYPSDIVLIDGGPTGEDSYTLKLKQVTRGNNGVIELEGVLWDVELTTHNMAVNTYMANLWGHSQAIDNMIYATVWWLLDLPPLLESHGGYGVYLAMSGKDNNWGGAVLYKSADHGNHWSVVAGSAVAAPMGLVTKNPLLDRPAELFDLDSKVTVVFFNEEVSLASCTVDDLARGANPLCMGDEVVQFMNAVEISPGEWELSTFLRGRRGTDIPASMAAHRNGERVTLLAPMAVLSYADNEVHINQEMLYRGGSVGYPLDSLTTVPFTNKGRRITPLSPMGITGSRDVSNNLTISWIRRDRLYQTQFDGADLRNAEDLLQFEVDIMVGATVVRTIVVDDAVETTYSAADQITDGFTPGDPIIVNIYQMSAMIGRGNKGAAVV